MSDKVSEKTSEKILLKASFDGGCAFKDNLKKATEYQ
jgi:hypothetical protein